MNEIVLKEIHEAINRGYEKWEAGGCHEVGCGCVTVYVEKELADLLFTSARWRVTKQKVGDWAERAAGRIVEGR